jgi:hypothetical protein
VLHLTSGDATADVLRDARLPGTVATVVDPLHEGPAPADRTGEAWREARARFVAARGWETYEAARARFDQLELILACARWQDEVVLWFEHDLHCQLSLVWLLDRLARDAGDARLSLIGLGAFPGVEPFRGLGQLTPADLTVLHATRAPVTPVQLGLAHRAWAAFTAPAPEAIETLLAEDTTALPFLGAALRRHLEQFPSRDGGVSRTERQVLEALAEGAGERRAVFKSASAREEVPFLTDAIFWWHLERMAQGPAPLVARDGETVTLTATGRAVHEGRADWIALAGIDRWLGGVHLGPGGPLWRRDGARLRRDPPRGGKGPSSR